MKTNFTLTTWATLKITSCVQSVYLFNLSGTLSFFIETFAYISSYLSKVSLSGSDFKVCNLRFLYRSIKNTRKINSLPINDLFRSSKCVSYSFYTIFYCCSYPAGIHLLKVSYRNTKARCEICPKCLYC